MHSLVFESRRLKSVPMNTSSILIVDDQKSIVTALSLLLSSQGATVYSLSQPQAIPEYLREKNLDIVLLDMNFRAGINNGNEGLYWLKEIKKYDAAITVIMLTAYGEVPLAVEAVKQGAHDFILKPWENEKLLTTIQAGLKLRKSKIKIQQLERDKSSLTEEVNRSTQTFIGESAPMLELKRMITKVAATDANIMITGENGTGKEVIAREIHRQSLRNEQPMLSVDMGAIAESLFESELFGHMKGAFTGANTDRAGRFEVASGGTIFLDEIANLSLTLQAKLLHVLQTRTVTRIGSNKAIPVDIRLLAATNRNLEQMVADGDFREDLLYRMNTIQLIASPLRERGNDILLLADFYLDRYANRYAKEGLQLAEKTKKKLLQYKWPGNVRELQHSMEKAVILSDNEVLQPEDFFFQATINKVDQLSGMNLSDVEKQLIKGALKRHEGNMSAVAKELGITRPTLYSKIKKYDL